MSNQPIELQIYKQHRLAQEKYIYFLLAAAGGAIALSVRDTRGLALAASQAPLAGAVICWGLSFFWGCRGLAYGSATLRANLAYFKILSGNYPEVGSDPQRIQAASQGVLKAAESNSDKANDLGQKQFRMFVTGGAFYVAWHILEMYLLGASK